MALGMKKWIGLVGVGCFLVALRTLPPAALEVPARRNEPLQAERHLDALRGEIVYTGGQLQRLRWANAVIPATLAGGELVTFEFPDNALPEQIERVRGLILAEASQLGPPSADVALGVFFRDYRGERYPSAPTGYNLDAHYYFGERDGRAYCAAVHPVWRQSAEGKANISTVRSGSDGSYLGVCALIRQFGLPGPAVQAWLAGGGTALAASAQPGRGGLLLYRDVVNAALTRRGPLGVRNFAFGYVMTRVDYDRCFAGVAEGCAQLFLRPELENYRGPGVLPTAKARTLAPAQAMQGSSAFEPADFHVVADMAQDFGRERFLAWWTADGDVAEAFQASFGEDLGSWNLRRISRFIPITKPGPAVSQAGLLGGALLLAFASIIAGLWARRRRVA